MAHTNLETEQNTTVHDSGTALSSSRCFADAYTDKSCAATARDSFAGATNLAFDQGQAPGQGQGPKLDFAAAKPLQMHGPDIASAFKSADKLLPQAPGQGQGQRQGPGHAKEQLDRAGSVKKSASYLPDMSETLAALNVAY